MQEIKIGDWVKRKNGNVVYKVIGFSQKGNLLLEALRYGNREQISVRNAQIVEKKLENIK